MNLHTLELILRQLELPIALVSLGRRAEPAWCIAPTCDGRWEVYWADQGEQYSAATLPDESSACYYLLGKLVHDQVLAGQFELPG